MLFGFIVFVVAAGAGIGWWIHHRSLKGVVSDVTDIKNDLVKVKAAVDPAAAPVVPPKV